ncbi:hypothetical protein V2J09_013616, partial [Rumex salicifolius]
AKTTNCLAISISHNPKCFPIYGLYWNYRGVDKAGIPRNLLYMTRNHNVDILVLIEPKVSELMKFTMRVETQGFAGGLWLLWDDSRVTLQVITPSPTFLGCWSLVVPLLWSYFWCIGPLRFTRQRFWSELTEEVDSCIGPFAIIGDFNCILSTINRVGGSNHTPIMLTLDSATAGKRHRRPFRFEVAWLSHPDFQQILTSNWDPNSPAFVALARLRLKKADHLSKLYHVQQDISVRPTNALLQTDQNLQKDLERVLE